MSSRKADLGDIDEDFLLDSIKGGNKTKPTQPIVEPASVEDAVEKPKEPPKRKRNSTSDYGSIYLQRNEIKTRQCVYISREIHRKITKIVNVIADKQISVGGYVDTVLSQHLEANKEDINELYRKEKQSDDLI